MKKTYRFYGMTLMAVFMAIGTPACDGDDEEESGNGEKDVRIEEVIPSDIRKKMQKYMAIYDGVNPPNVKGCFVMSPAVNVYDSTNDYDPGEAADDAYMRFYNQNTSNNTVSYEDYNDGNTNEATGAFISGEDNNFSVYFDTNGKSGSVRFKLALVVSGTKASDGIRNIYYAFVMTEKNSNGDDDLIEVGDFRVFKDKDGVASPASWTFSTRAILDEITTKGLLKKNK